MSIITIVIPKILPVFLLISLGVIVRKKSILSSSSIDDLKKVIINLVLPCVFYFAFLKLELQLNFIVLIVGMFVICVLLLLIGFALRPLKLSESSHFPFLFTGFEFGMMGASLFGAVFGIDKVGYIGLVGLGHELFIWFIFATLLVIKRDHSTSFREISRSFIKSPIIIAIVLGTVFNVTGFGKNIEHFSVVQALYISMHFIEGLIVPLILLIIGFGLELRGIRFKSAMAVVMIRLGILIPLALIINQWIVRGFFGLDVLYEAAVFIFFILPPPFIIPLFMGKELQKEQVEINGVLVVHSFFSLMIFALYYGYFMMTHS
jgi:malate permease and related proteins